MKKLFLIVFAFLIIGGVNLSAQDWWYLRTREGGSAAQNNTVTLRAGQDNFAYIAFRDDRPKGTFTKLRLNFTISQPVEVIWQCVYHTSMSGSVLGAAGEKPKEEGVSTGVRDSGPIETDVSIFTLVWAGNIKVVDTAIMNGACLKIPIPRGAGNTTFTLTGVEFVDLKN